MKKLFTISLFCVVALATFTSCATASVAYDEIYSPHYYDDENIVVVDNICYVYYENPTTVFLNTLYLIDGAYYYWYFDRYIPVIFPRWYAWSPHRYFYFHENRWMWRDRIHYNHADYRRTHHWKDYRIPSNRNNVNMNRQHQNTNKPRTINRRNVNKSSLSKRIGRSSSTRTTVHMNRGNHSQSRSFGSGRR